MNYVNYRMQDDQKLLLGGKAKPVQNFHRPKAGNAQIPQSARQIKTIHNIAVILFPGFSSHFYFSLRSYFHNPDLFGEMKKKKINRWDVISNENYLIKSDDNVYIAPTISDFDHDAYDLLIIMGNYSPLIKRAPSAQLKTINSALKQAFNQSTPILITSDAASVLMADTISRDVGWQDNRNIFRADDTTTAINVLGHFNNPQANDDPIEMQADDKKYSGYLLPSRNVIYDTLIQSAIKIMEHHREQPMNIYQLAEKLKVSRSYLNNAFKVATGRSPKAIWREVALKSARATLLESDTSIAN